MALPTKYRADQRQWWRRGFTCNEQQDGPHKAWPAHQHAVDEIVKAEQGSLRVRHGATESRLRPHEELVVPAGTVHAIRNPSPQTVKYLYGFRCRGKRR